MHSCRTFNQCWTRRRLPKSPGARVAGIALQLLPGCDRVCCCALSADEIDDAALAVTMDAFYFLRENGCISFGVLPGG